MRRYTVTNCGEPQDIMRRDELNNKSLCEYHSNNKEIKMDNNLYYTVITGNNNRTELRAYVITDGCCKEVLGFCFISSHPHIEMTDKEYNENGCDFQDEIEEVILQYIDDKYSNYNWIEL